MEKIRKVTEDRGKTGKLIEPVQLRAARVLLNWTQADLAAAASVAPLTVKRAETETTVISPKTREALRDALENAGVEFIPENGGGLGVRLKLRRS